MTARPEGSGLRARRRGLGPVTDDPLEHAMLLRAVVNVASLCRLYGGGTLYGHADGTLHTTARMPVPPAQIIGVYTVPPTMQQLLDDWRAWRATSAPVAREAAA